MWKSLWCSPRRRAAAIAVAMGLACCGCVATQTIVHFDADPEVVRRASAIELIVSFDGRVVQQRGPITFQEGLATWPAIQPVEVGAVGQDARFTVQGRVFDSDGGFFIEASVNTGFVAGERREVRVCFDDDCLGLSGCADGTTCVDGRCVGHESEPLPIGMFERAPGCAQPTSPIDGGQDSGPTDGGEDAGPEDGGDDAGEDAGDADPPCDCPCPGDVCEAGLCRPNVPAVTEQLALSSGRSHACVRTVSGTLHCWGDNASGQLALPRTTTTSLPRAIVELPMGTVISTAAAAAHTCAIVDESGSRGMFCWGSNEEAQLGQPSAPMPFYETPVQEQRLLDNYSTVSAFSDFTCGVTLGRETRCVGSNVPGGKLSINPSNAGRNMSVLVGLYDVVSAGEDHACAINGSDEVECWGSNLQSQLGRVDDTDTFQPERTDGGDTFLFVDAANQATCAITVAGVLMCWGQSVSGHLGVGGPDDITMLPTAVSTSLDRWGAVDVGRDHTCAIRQNGGEPELHCWGDNAVGQLAQEPSSVSGTTAPTVPIPPVNGRWMAVSVGDRYSCATTEAGTVHCWGRNDSGQLGGSAPSSSADPVRVCLTE